MYWSLNVHGILQTEDHHESMIEHQSIRPCHTSTLEAFFFQSKGSRNVKDMYTSSYTLVLERIDMVVIVLVDIVGYYSIFDNPVPYLIFHNIYDLVISLYTHTSWTPRGSIRQNKSFMVSELQRLNVDRTLAPSSTTSSNMASTMSWLSNLDMTTTCYGRHSFSHTWGPINSSVMWMDLHHALRWWPHRPRKKA